MNFSTSRIIIIIVDKLNAIIVFFCLDDVVGLLYQHLTQSADISCGLDYWKRRLVYYDTW
jgi:hypothetical protein